MSTLDRVANNDFVVPFTLDGMGVAEFHYWRPPAQGCDALAATPSPTTTPTFGGLLYSHHGLFWTLLQKTLPAGARFGDLVFNSESLLTHPKCRTQPNVLLCSQHARPTPTPHIPVWPSAREGSPVVCFAQPSLPTRLTRGRPNSPFPDACPFTLVPPGAQASEAFRGQGWGGVGSG